MVQTMNTYCHKCGDYTATRFVNFPAAEEIECRCAICGKFKDYYSYAKKPDPELGAEVRLNRALKIICVLSFIIFAAVMFVYSLRGVKHETAALITIIMSLGAGFVSALMIDEKADEEWKKGAQK